jgi:CRP-like cAMP-binding protein
MRAAEALATVFRNQGLRRVQLAWGASVAAEWAHFVALGVFAYETGGTRAVGIAGLIRMLPSGIVGPLAASLADRFRRERFLAAVYAVGAAGAAGSAAGFYAGRSEPVVFALAAVVGVAVTLVRPAHQSVLPSLSGTPAELLAANGATSTIESLSTLLGPLAAGLAVSILSAGAVFAGAAVALALAAALLLLVRVEGWLAPQRHELHARGLVLGGVAALARNPRARLVVGLMVAQTFVRGCLNVLIVVAAFRVLGSHAGGVGYLTAAIGLGGLVGAFAALALEGRRLAIPFAIALVFWGAPIAFVAPINYLGVAMCLLAVVGMANSIEDVAGFTLLQRVVPDRLLGRVLGLFWGVAMAAVGLGSLAATGLVSAVGPRPAFLVVGVILPVLTVVSWRRLVAIDRTVGAPSARITVLGSVPMFAPLSVGARERLATRLSRVDVPAGTDVIRAGDAGDRFYIVEDGSLEVVGDGFVKSAGPGDHFGEIALLRDVPRTATVRALADSKLYALSRDDFLAVVGAHSGVREAGDAVAEERLAASGTRMPAASAAGRGCRLRQRRAADAGCVSGGPRTPASAGGSRRGTRTTTSRPRGPRAPSARRARHSSRPRAAGGAGSRPQRARAATAVGHRGDSLGTRHRRRAPRSRRAGRRNHTRHSSSGGAGSPRARAASAGTTKRADPAPGARRREARARLRARESA